MNKYVQEKFFRKDIKFLLNKIKFPCEIFLLIYVNFGVIIIKSTHLNITIYYHTPN